MKTAIPQNLPGGSTAMVQGFYRGWDELRTVPAGQQSGLRVIVLFTDGASNSVPGMYDGSGVAKGLRTYDFPKNFPDPDRPDAQQPVHHGSLPHADRRWKSELQHAGRQLEQQERACRGAAPAADRASISSVAARAFRSRFRCRRPALKVNGVPQNIAPRASAIRISRPSGIRRRCSTSTTPRAT